MSMWHHSTALCQILLSAYVTVAGNDISRGGQLGEPHRAASMQFLGGNPDLSSETKLTTIGDSGRGVNHDGGRIHASDKALGRRLTIGNNRLGVTTRPTANMGQRIINIVNDAGSDIQRVVLRGPVVISDIGEFNPGARGM